MIQQSGTVWLTFKQALECETLLIFECPTLLIVGKINSNIKDKFAETVNKIVDVLRQDLQKSEETTKNLIEYLEMKLAKMEAMLGGWKGFLKEQG